MLVVGSEAGTVLVAMPAGLLLVAGGGKLLAGRDLRGQAPAAEGGLPAWATRPLGAFEVCLAAGCLAWPVAPLLAAAAVLYAVFAVYTGQRVARGQRGGCGCLWGDERLDPVHVAVDALLAAALAVAAANPPGSLLSRIAGAPLLGCALAVSVGACVACLVLVLRHLTDALTAYRPGPAGSR